MSRPAPGARSAGPALEALRRLPRRCALKLQAVYASLKRAERKGADFLLARPEEVGGLLIGDFASRAGCSEPTVVRLARRLGYAGYPDMRADFAAGAAEASGVEYDTIRSDDDPLHVLGKVFESTLASIRDTQASIDPEAFARAVDVLSSAQRVMFAGVGDAALVALEAHQRFVRIGVQSVAPLDLDLQLIQASQLGRGDALVVFSHSGRSRSVLEVARVARRARATIVALTNFPVSPIARRAHIVLQTSAFSTTPTGEVISKRVTELCVLEALHLNVLLRRGRAAARHLRAANAVVGINKL
jgi:RpiR family carbohydrate utilization transcriptional regulator